MDLNEFVESGTDAKKLEYNNKLVVWNEALKCLSKKPPNSSADMLTALKAIKIITRDRNQLEDLVDKTTTDLLTMLAGIYPNSSLESLDEDSLLVVTEAQACVSNLILQTAVAKNLFSDGPLIRGLMEIVSKRENSELSSKVYIFNMKILFLITALMPKARDRVRNDFDGIKTLINVLQSFLSEAKDRAEKSASKEPPMLKNQDVDCMCELLKILFNTTLFSDTVPTRLSHRDIAAAESTLNEKDEKLLREVCEMIQTFFIVNVESPEKSLALKSNCINLFANIPLCTSHPLFGTLNKEFLSPGQAVYEYEDECMNVPHDILEILLYRIDHAESADTTTVKESITPILSVLCKLSVYHRKVRKFFRATILPPLRDMTNRPEVGDQARNKLCKLLTSPIDSVNQMSAEFLFILCKESVTRLVKYTGYGNAAGLLARRGLMLGGHGPNAGEYSDEEDSETEEYAENVHKVNPIVGCVEPKHPSPLEGMSDEQKEHEALKLVNLINDLSNVGIVKPAMPGPDGKPVEMKHVLQLQEHVPRNEPEVDSGDSD